jgi:hypothetical protein
MKIGVWVVGALALVLGSCTDATAITDGVCGNYVLEPANREDCDRPGDTCTADCRIACAPAAAAVCDGTPDGLCCPQGAVCGADQVCHVATGLFDPVDRSFEFTAADFAVGRVDGDLIADVLGASSGSIEARFGHSATPLERRVDRRAPFATGSFAIGDTTGDGRLDVLFPTGAGIFGFETSGPEPEAITFPARRDAGVQHARIAARAGPALARVDYQHAAARFVMAWEPNATNVAICNGMALGPQHQLFGRGLHVIGGSQAALVVGIPGAASFSICIERPGSSSRIDVPLRAGEGETFFADVSGTACPELFVPVLGATTEGTLMLAGTGTPGACGLGAPIQLANPDGPIGSPLLVLEAGTRPALVTSLGIFEVPMATQIVEATRSWRYAAVGDFNHDGRDDFATIGFQEDVEIIEQRATLGEWNVVRIPTSTVPVQLATGDFDGDDHDDLAIATLVGGADRTARIAVTYGGSTLAFDPPVVAGVIDHFTQMIATELVDPSLPEGFDHSDDLVIAHDGATPASPGKLTYLFGSASRNITSPWLFQSKFGGEDELAGEGWAVVIGRFGAERTPGAVAAFTVSRSAPKSEPAPDPTPLAADATETLPRDASHPAYVALGWNGVDATFDGGPEDVVDCTGARFGSVSLPGGELLLGFSGLDPKGPPPQGCGYFHLATRGGEQPSLRPIACAKPGLVEKLHGVSAVRAIGPLADVDLGVLVTQPGTLGARNATARIWRAAVSGGAMALEETVDLSTEVRDAVGGGAVACMDAVAGELAATGDGHGTGPELLVACSVGGTTRVFVRYAARERGTPPKYRELLDTGEDVAVRIRTGDVNGDGLDDVVYTTGAVLHVRLQCDAHAEGCR